MNRAKPLLALLLAITTTACAQDAFTVGNKGFPVIKKTAKGTLVVPMWDIQAAIPPATPYPLLRKAEHALVWSPATAAEGGYNHYACLIRFNGTLYAMWSNHPGGEDRPGQRILYSTSTKWGEWTRPQELFAPPGPVINAKQKGIHLKSDRWVIVDGKLYAIAYVHGAGVYPIAREVRPGGAFGDPFPLRALPAKAELPSYMHQPTPPAIAQRLLAWYPAHDRISFWDAEAQGVPRKAIDGAQLIETFSYRASDDTLVMMARSWGTNSNPVHNNRVYVSFAKTYGQWTTPYPTDIPDSPTRGDALRLPDGTILLIGTHYAPKLDSALYLDRDPLSIAVSKDGFHFSRAYTFRTGAPRTWHIPNVGGRNPGFAYTSSILDEGYLCTLYSIGKEDIGISRVPLSELAK